MRGGGGKGKGERGTRVGMGEGGGGGGGRAESGGRDGADKDQLNSSTLWCTMNSSKHVPICFTLIYLA